MNSDLLHGFYLSDIRVEPLKGQVTDRAGSRHLPPKAVEVLLCLANSPGELVTRDNLLTSVWGSGKGSQEALGHAVSEIRHALDDHPDNPVYIQTLPKRGYRLVVDPVLESEHGSSIVLGAYNAADAPDIGFLENLKQRGVIETVLAYLIVGWLLIQVADIVFSQLHFPDWAATFVTVLVIAGFPIAIVLSWYLEFRDGKAIAHELSPAAARRKRFSRTYLSVIGALGVASIAVFVYDRYIGLPTQTTDASATLANYVDELPIAENSIAVLPFFNVDGGEQTQIFANGFVDDIISRLSRVPGLLVSSRGDSHTMAPNSSSEEVRRRLRVAMYLDGSVQFSGDTIRIIVQMIDSATGFQIQSRTFDRNKDDFFAIRDEVTDLTVSSLRVSLSEETQSMSAGSSRNPNLDTYVLYRRGVDEADKPRTLTTIANALGWFDAALAVDPEYAAAYAGKCDVFLTEFTLTDDPVAVSNAESACARALEFNSNLDVVHAALGDVYASTGKYEASTNAYLESLRINPKNVASMLGLAEVYRLQQNPAAAEELLQRAVGLQPGNWQAYNSLGVFYFRQGSFTEAANQFAKVVAIDSENRNGLANLAASFMLDDNFEAAIPAFELALEIEEQPVAYSNLGLMYYYLGRYDEATAAIRSAIELTPNDHLVWSNLGDVLFATGRTDEARSAFEKAEQHANVLLEVNSNDAAVTMDMAWIHAMLDQQERAHSEIRMAVQALPDDPYSNYIEALIHNRFGNTDAALTALENAAAKGYSTAILRVDPHLASLRDEPRFGQIINKKESGRSP